MSWRERAITPSGTEPVVPGRIKMARALICKSPSAWPCPAASSCASTQRTTPSTTASRRRASAKAHVRRPRAAMCGAFSLVTEERHDDIASVSNGNEEQKALVGVLHKREKTCGACEVSALPAEADAL